MTKILTVSGKERWNAIAGPTGGVVVLTDGATISWNLNQGNAIVTLGGNRTLSNPVGGLPGKRYTLKVIQDGTGGRLLSFGTNYRFPHGVKPGISTTADQEDILTFYFDGTYMHHVDTDRHMTDQWTPIEVASSTLICWLDADQISGKGDGDTVTTWDDISGSVTDHSLTTANSPTYQINMKNGYPAVRFEGAGVSGTFAPGPWNPGENVCYIVVASPRDSTPTSRRLLSGSQNWLWHPRRDSATTSNRFHRLAWQTYGATVNQYGWTLTVITDADGTNGLFRANGVDIDTNLTSNTGADNIFIGPYTGASTTEWCNADIAEVLVFDAEPSAEDLGLVESYLNAKYDIY